MGLETRCFVSFLTLPFTILYPTKSTESRPSSKNAEIDHFCFLSLYQQLLKQAPASPDPALFEFMQSFRFVEAGTNIALLEK